MMLEFHEKHMDSEIFQKTKKKFDGVDGRDVADLEQLLHPRPHTYSTSAGTNRIFRGAMSRLNLAPRMKKLSTPHSHPLWISLLLYRWIRIDG
jgi:hypothetical protein